MSGASVKSFEHYGQTITSDSFRYFDYGKEENMKRYGSEIPPNFPLDKIYVPIALFIGTADLLGTVKDNEWFIPEISQAIVFNEMYEYGHKSFLIAKNMTYLNDIKDLLQEYHPIMKTNSTSIT
jgi:hypothetical protein